MARKLGAAVVGSGFGGLAAAIRLQASGFKTTILERRDQLGGRAYVYHDNGFLFDAGPTVITAPEAVDELFRLAGKRREDYVDLIPIHPFYRLYWPDGVTFDYSNDEASLVEQIRRLDPRDVKGYRDFFHYSQKVFEAGYTELVHVPFQSFWDMIRVSPQLVKLEAFRSVYAMVSRHIREPHLRQAFSFHSLLIGGNPFSASSIYTLIHFLERRWGVYFPKGGTGALVRALAQLFTDLGGEIKLGCEVDQIMTQADQVTGIRTKGGEVASYDLVVSNADVVHTYQKLLKATPSVERVGRRLANARHSMSLFIIYFGTKRRYPGLAHHNIIFGPRYQELLGDIFDRGVLADDFSLYLHVPTVTDSSLAPPGCEGFYVLSPVPHLGKFDSDWKTVGENYADRILAFLEQHYLPDLRANIVTKRIFTPQDFSRDLNAHLGSAFSLEPVLWQSAYFRVGNRERRVHGLYFVGAGTHPGAGVPGVINSAKATVGVILKDFAEKSLTQTHGGVVHAGNG